MLKCSKCEKYDTCRKPCWKVEKLLFSLKIYNSEYIRKRKYREIPVADVDKVAVQRAFYLKYGEKRGENAE